MYSVDHFLFITRFGQFIASTLPTFAVCEKFVTMEINNEEKIDGGNIALCFIFSQCNHSALNQSL